MGVCGPDTDVSWLCCYLWPLQEPADSELAGILILNWPDRISLLHSVSFWDPTQPNPQITLGELALRQPATTLCFLWAMNSMQKNSPQPLKPMHDQCIPGEILGCGPQTLPHATMFLVQLTGACRPRQAVAGLVAIWDFYRRPLT